jgi:hypothetical protein
MAGNLYRAIQRTGGLQPVINAMNDIYEKKKMAEYYEGLNKEANDYMTKFQQMQDPNYGKTEGITHNIAPQQFGAVNPAVGQVVNAMNNAKYTENKLLAQNNPEINKLFFQPKQQEQIGQMFGDGGQQEQLTQRGSSVNAKQEIPMQELFENQDINIGGTPAMSKAEKYNQAQSDYLEFMRKNYNPEMGAKGQQALNTQGAFIGGQANLFKPKEGYDEFKEGTRYVHRDTGKEIYYPEEKETKPTTQYLPDEFNEKHGDYLVKWRGHQNADGSWTKTDSDKFNVKESVGGGRGEDANVGEFTQIAKYMEEAKNLSNSIKTIDRTYKNEKKDGKYFTHEQELKGGGTKKIYGSQEEIENTKKDNFKTLQAMHDKIDLEISEQIPDYKVMKPEIWQWIKKGEKTYKENNKIEKLTSKDKRIIAKSIINEYVNGQTKKLGLLPSQDIILKSILIDQFEQMYY